MIHHRRTHEDDSSTAARSSATPSSQQPRRRRRRQPRPSQGLILVVQQTRWIVAVVSVALVAITLVSKVVQYYGSSSTPSEEDPAPPQDHHQRPLHAIRPHSPDTIQDLENLEFSDIYRIPDSMEQVGDRSDHYARLRKDTDAYLDSNPELVLQPQSPPQTYTSRILETHTSDQVPYDIYNCPATPPDGYPYVWKTLDLLKAWPPDQTQPPTNDQGHGLVYQSLCVFDYQTDYTKAETYRNAMLPFVVKGDPEVQKTVVRWSLPDYMDLLLGTVPHRTEYSANNHFMYYVPPPKPRPGRMRMRGQRNLHQRTDESSTSGNRPPPVELPQGWKEPTKMMRMSYQEWMVHANVTAQHTTRDDPHWYFRLIGCGAMGNDGSCDAGSSEYLYDELPYFQPKPSLYVVQPNEQKGIHCRFGMRGVIAENHFDGSRNSIALLKGSRRYILSHPNQCSNLALYPKGHPSARHSAVDWSKPDLNEYPEFAQAESNEVVLQPGHVLYLPTNWFHYIVSLELNFQCNTRSGIEAELMPFVHECGF